MSGDLQTYTTMTALTNSSTFKYSDPEVSQTDAAELQRLAGAHPGLGEAIFDEYTDFEAQEMFEDMGLSLMDAARLEADKKG